MEKMREEFEGWMSEYFNGTSIERRAHGYIDQISDAMWISWQASRAALCVELPENCKGMALTVSEFHNQLDKAGVSYK